MLNVSLSVLFCNCSLLLQKIDEAWPDLYLLVFNSLRFVPTAIRDISLYISTPITVFYPMGLNFFQTVRRYVPFS